MTDQIDYSIHYKRWHVGDRNEYLAQANTYHRLCGEFIKAIPRHARILDYGCGSGLLVYYLREHFDNVEGVDASAQQVASALVHGLPVTHLPVGEFNDWTDKHRDCYDVVFLLDVLEHIPPQDQIVFLRRLVSTIKHKGQIYIKVPNASSLMAGRWRYIDWTHRSSFTECSLDFVCLNSGLKDMEYLDDETSLAPRYPWLPRWGIRNYYLKKIGRAIWRIYLGAEIGREADNVKLGINLFVRATKS